MPRNRSMYAAALMAAAFVACSDSTNSPLAPPSDAAARALSQPAAGPNLYVGNSESVAVYGPGQTTPLRVLNRRVKSAFDLKFDASDNLYVADYEKSRIPVIPPGASLPSRVIKRDVGLPLSLAFDQSGRLYVSNVSKSAVDIYAHGTSKVIRTIVQSFSFPQELLIDDSGYLYVSYYYGQNGIHVDAFTNVGKTLEYILEEAGSDPVVIALDAHEHLYTGNRDENTITEYQAHTGTAVRVISNGVSIPTALAFDSRGNLYCACGSAIQVYAPGASSPKRSISKGVDVPEALVLDISGNLYVANDGNSSVTVYAPGATSPSATITDGISYPKSLAFGP
jgi:hypothetical protein